MSELQLVNVRAGFLTGGPVIDYSLPASFHPVPMMTVAIDIGTGAGRELTYFPDVIPDSTAGEGLERQGSLRGKGQRDIELWLRPDDDQYSQIWFLRWVVPSGTLMMHIRCFDDGEAALERVAENLEIVEDDIAVTVLPHHPLSRMALGRASYAENTHFLEIGPGGFLEGRVTAAVEVARPGRYGGLRTIHENGDWLQLHQRVGGFDVSVGGRKERADLEQVADLVVESVSAA